MRRALTTLLLLAITASAGMAQSVTYPEPAPIPAQPSPEELRAALLGVHGSLCQGIQDAAQILTQTGTLPQAIPVVMASTGLQPADLEQREAAACRSDPSDLTLEQLRASNRTAVWLLQVHLAAMREVLAAP